MVDAYWPDRIGEDGSSKEAGEGGLDLHVEVQCRGPFLFGQRACPRSDTHVLAMQSVAGYDEGKLHNLASCCLTRPQVAKFVELDVLLRLGASFPFRFFLSSPPPRHPTLIPALLWCLSLTVKHHRGHQHRQHRHANPPLPPPVRRQFVRMGQKGQPICRRKVCGCHAVGRAEHPGRQAIRRGTTHKAVGPRLQKMTRVLMELIALDGHPPLQPFQRSQDRPNPPRPLLREPAAPLVIRVSQVRC